MTDLQNDAAPPGGAVVTISAAAFKKWMVECGFEAGTGNPNQEVYFTYKAPKVTIQNTEVTPNWHITAMTSHRDGGDCVNFHFKIEMGKAASHYWHYVVHRGATGTYHWVGDPNPHLPTTNEGGGGAAGDLQKLLANRTEATLKSRVYGLENKMTRKIQARMLKTLKTMVGKLRLTYANGRID